MKKKERIKDLESRADEVDHLIEESRRAIDSLVKQVDELQQWVRILKPQFGGGDRVAIPAPLPKYPRAPELWCATDPSTEAGSGMPVVQTTTADECGDVRDLPSPPIAAEAAL